MRIVRIITSSLLLFTVSACSFFGGNQSTPDGYVRHCIKLLDREALYADRQEWKEARSAILAEAKSFTTMDQARTGELFCEDSVEPDVRTDTPLEDATVWIWLNGVKF